MIQTMPKRKRNFFLDVFPKVSSIFFITPKKWGGGVLEQSLTAPEKTVFQDQHISLVGAGPKIFSR